MKNIKYLRINGKQLEFAPITQIYLNGRSDSYIPTQNELLFFYRIVKKLLDSLFTGDYVAFDAHTTANCCHGVAVYASQVIAQALSIHNLPSLRKEAQARIELLEHGHAPYDIWMIPAPLIRLAQLYILADLKGEDPHQQRRCITRTKNLQKIAPIGINFCNRISHELKKYFSNLVAKNYSFYLHAIPPGMCVNRIPVRLWGKYVQTPYLRTCYKGMQYASALFSMEVILASLIVTKAKIAIVNDLLGVNGAVKGRYIALLEGDGVKDFCRVSLQDLHKMDPLEPVIIFAGCAYSDVLDQNSLTAMMDPWMDHVTTLVLAGDTHHPQFPEVRDDPLFNSDPVQVEEPDLQSYLQAFARIPGVSAADPTLFCIAHIYPASLKQVILAIKYPDRETLPQAFLPNKFLESTCTKIDEASMSI